MAIINSEFKKGATYTHTISHEPLGTTDDYSISSITANNDLVTKKTGNRSFSLRYDGSLREFQSTINLNITGITGYNTLPIEIECNGTLKRDPMEIYNPNESPVTVSIKQNNNGAPLLMIKYKLNDDNDWTTIKNNEVTPGNDVSLKDFLIPAKKSLLICSLEDNEITDINNNITSTLTTWCHQYNHLYFSCNNNINNLIIRGDIMSLINENTMAEQCFYQLFKDFKVLKTVDKNFLSSKTLSEQCYYEMFKGCTSLTDAPDLISPILANQCYKSMFEDCTSLVTPPILSATSVSTSCCYLMFNRCTALTTAPTLNAQSLKDASECYKGMFSGCSALTEAPYLPATTLANSCYAEMFSGCTSLTTAPSRLPATTLQGSCYESMFSGCNALTQAPILEATTLTQQCYRTMFNGCGSLNEINMLATTAEFDSNFDFQTYGWLANTATDSPDTSNRGTLYITSQMKSLRDACKNTNHYDPLHIPENWDVIII